MESSLVAPVVVGVDDSASSLSAVRLAARHAASYGRSLHIVHAFNWLPRWPEPIGAGRSGADTETGTRPGITADDVIRRAVAAAHQAAPGTVITTRLLEGAATSTLLRQARTAALIAIGDGGLSTHVCLPTHSVAVHITARAACSVLVARAATPSDGPIVVGVNGSPASEQALDFAFDTAARRHAELIVVRATTAAPGTDPHDDELRDLAELVIPLEDNYHLTARVQLLHGEPEAMLLAASTRAGLVIIGARGQQPYRGLLGSAAQTLLHHSPAPLILVRGLMRAQLHGSGRHRTTTATAPTA